MAELLLNRFHVIKRLSESGTVLVKDPRGATESLVLKVIRNGALVDKLRKVDEICWYEGLVHRNIPHLIDAGVTKSRDLFVLRKYLPEPLSPENMHPSQIGDLLGVVCFLHAQGKIHGSIKPSNVFVCGGRIQLVDAGNRFLKPDLHPSDRRFDAPELLSGSNATAAADYYSIGVLLYTHYARRTPFIDPESENLATKVRFARPTPLRELCAVSDSVSKMVDDLLQTDPTRRKAGFDAVLKEFSVTDSPASSPAFIGRSALIGDLDVYLFNKRPAELEVLFLSSEPGGGKSRLIRELQARSKFLRAVFLDCSSATRAENPLPLVVSLVVEGLQQHFVECNLENQVANFSQTLGRILSTETPVGQDSNLPSAQRIAHDLVALLALISSHTPLILCFEDIEFSDHVIRDFLELLCCRASELRVRLILTSRETAESIQCVRLMRSHVGQKFTELSLPPLSETDSLSLVRFIQNDYKRCSQVVKMAGGNPSCLLTFAVAADSTWHQTDIIATMRQRLHDVLDKYTLRVLHVLAMTDPPINKTLLAAVLHSPGEIASSCVENLRNADVLRNGRNGLEFRVQALKSAIAAGLSATKRRAIHSNCYWTLLTNGYPLAIVAHHAFGAHLWEQAATHYSVLAKNSLDHGQFATALDHYRKLRASKKRLRANLNIEDEVSIGSCLARTGNHRSAQTIFQRLLSDPAVQADHSTYFLIISRYAELNRSSQLQVIEDALERNPTDPRRAVRLFSHLSVALVLKGNLSQAKVALEKAAALHDAKPSPEAQLFVANANGFLLMNAGQFKEALRVFNAIKTKELAVKAAIRTNVAICLEHTGHIKAAYALQSEGYEAALKAGHALGQAWCLLNLGSFLIQRGDFEQAATHFSSAERLGRNANREHLVSLQANISRERSRLEIAQGKYALAFDSLTRVTKTRELYENERLQASLDLLNLYLALGQNELPVRLVEQIENSPLSSNPLFTVQVEALRAQLLTSDQDACARLYGARQLAARSSLSYECALITLTLTDRLCKAGQFVEAQGYARKVARMATQQGYGPLAARGTILAGKATDHPKERMDWLARGYKLSLEMGLTELVAESAYHLGQLMFTSGQLTSARDYLQKSTMVTAQLLEQVPARFQSKYLESSWRQGAQKLLRKCVDQIGFALPQADRPKKVESGVFFQLLYRAHTAARAVHTVKACIQVLQQILERVPGRAGVIVSMREEEVTWQPIHAELTDDLKKRVIVIAKKATDKPYFEDRGQAKGPVAWLPFRTDVYHGGIYLYCTHRGYPLGENEIEFLTILGTLTANAFEQIQQRAARSKAISKPEYQREFHGLVGASRAIQEVFSQIELAAGSSATVLIEGETGTGKELVARAIHQLGTRAKAPFIPVDCGAIPEGLIESELFGAARGAYTGATTDRRGLFESANGGTLFLDEISNTTPGIQVKLLRVLQEREVRRVGDNKARPFDVRLIAASNQSLRELVEEGRFRQDLLYRINVLQVTLPPLRNRREDIPLLAEHFLQRLNSRNNTKKRLASGAFAPLLNHGFPGNVRELQNMVERAFFASKGATISALPIESGNRPIPPTDEVQVWFRDLTEGRKNFWTTVHDRYKRRDISRENVIALLDLGLRRTRGSYKNLAALFRLDAGEYRRLMDFLRRSNCLLDFRPYRQTAAQ